MTDLTKIEKPLGLLTEEEQGWLRDAHTRGEAIEVYAQGGWYHVPTQPRWKSWMVYRLRPKPAEPAIKLPWGALQAIWQWAAADANGEVYVYDAEPISERGGRWVCGRGKRCALVGHVLRDVEVAPGTAWDETLTERPS